MAKCKQLRPTYWEDSKIFAVQLVLLKIHTNFSLSSHTNSDSVTNELSANKIPTTTKATAIVAPQRKTHTFEEITNFTDAKPPFKSATLGRHQRPTLNWRNKDEKSEKSVKDKIAMFSTSTSDISHILPKSTTIKDKSNGSMRHCAKSIENIFSIDSSTPTKSMMMMMSPINGNGDRSCKKKAMSMENLDDFTDDDSIDCHSEREEIKSYTPVSRPFSLQTRPPLLNLNRAQSVEQLLSTPILPLRPPPPTTAPVSLERRISFNGYTQSEENRQKSIANILENRKKNISKLRGLVIPEHEVTPNQKVFDLPVIRSKECELIRSISTTPTTTTPTRKTFSDLDSLRPAPRTILKKV
jgi:hypothetical protein